AVRARIVRFIVYKEIAPHPEVADAAAELDEAFLIQDALQRLVRLGKHQREILDAAGMQSVQKPVPRQHGDTLSPADEADLRIYAVLQDVELAFALFDDNRSMDPRFAGRAVQTAQENHRARDAPRFSINHRSIRLRQSLLLVENLATHEVGKVS